MWENRNGMHDHLCEHLCNHRQRVRFEMSLHDASCSRRINNKTLLGITYMMTLENTQIYKVYSGVICELSVHVKIQWWPNRYFSLRYAAPQNAYETHKKVLFARERMRAFIFFHFVSYKKRDTGFSQNIPQRIFKSRTNNTIKILFGRLTFYIPMKLHVQKENNMVRLDFPNKQYLCQ